MANESGFKLLFYGSPKRTGFAQRVAGPAITDFMEEELQKRIVPQIEKAYDKMTEGWSEKPTPTIKVGQTKGVGNFVEITMDESTTANKKWIMVDVAGRKSGANIVKKIKFLEPTQTSSELFTVSGKGFKAKRLSVGAGFTPVFETRKLGKPTLVRGVANRPPLRFQAGYSPRTSPVGKYGGPGTKSDPWVTKLQVRQGAVTPRLLTATNILAALQGKSSPLSSIVKPWLSDKGPLRDAYRAAFFRAIGRRI